VTTGGWKRSLSVTLATVTLGLALSAPVPVYATALPGKLTALPNPPGAPERNIFLVTFPHGHATPVEAVFHFHPSHGSRQTIVAPLKKLNRYQYEAVWTAVALGRVQVKVYGRHQALLAQDQYPVVQAKPDVVGRVIVGGLFIAVSLWFWRRQQRYYRDPRR
jgi:hypothetical protein